MRRVPRALVTLAILAALLAAAMLAAACWNGDTPEASPTPTSVTTEPTASPTPTPRPATPSATRPPEATPPPSLRATHGRFTIQLFDFDEPESIGIRRQHGLLTATADGVACTTVNVDVLEPPAIVLGGPDQPEACRREGAWVALLAGSDPDNDELWEHFRLRIGAVAPLGNYATGTPSEWPVTAGAGVFEHTGVLVIGFEIDALFGGNCPVASVPTWISPPDDLPFFNMVIEASGAPAPDPFGVAMYRVRFPGEISPLGSYGHDGLYRYEIVPTNLASAELADDCDWGATSEYRQARDRWLAAAIRDSRFTIQRRCECPDEWSAPTLVTVRDGIAVSATIEGAPAPEGAALSIDDLFTEIGNALDEPVATSVSYDPDLGIPLDVQLDLEAIAVDGGLSLTVSDFERLD